MVSDESAMDRLAQLFREYRALAAPRVGGRFDLMGAEIDLYEEDSYLAGLVSRYLSHRPLGVESIELDSSIDSRLEQATSRAVAAHEVLREFTAYRLRMKQLAEMLSEASATPIRYVTRKTSGDLRS